VELGVLCIVRPAGRMCGVRSHVLSDVR
jgi:hypothetical protein